MKLGVNKHALKHTKDSKFSHYDGPIEELIKLAEARWGFAKDGYMEGVMEVTVPSDKVYCGVVKVKPGMNLRSVCDFRPGGEERGEDAYIQTTAIGPTKLKAKFTRLAFYHRDLLDGTGEEWQLVTILASLDEDEPMHPIAMARNHLGLPGGSEGTFTADQFAQSVIYWSTRTMIG
jgi:hypothetical protein